MRRTHLVPLAIVLGGCGGSVGQLRPASSHPAGVASRTGPAPAARHRGQPLALVTAETENRLLVVSLRSGRVLRSLPLATDPENVAAGANAIVVVSSKAGEVSLLDPRTLRVTRVVGGLRSPHIPAIAPGGRYAYVTDDARGTVSVIRLRDGALTSTVRVGAGAHHLTFSPDGRTLWIALGESASTIVTLDSSDPAHPRVTGSFDPGFRVHDLRFEGTRVWLTSATGPDVKVLDARTRAFAFMVRVGAPPQHIAFDGADAYLTSGYGRSIVRVDTRTGRVLARASDPYGSFELDSRDGVVVTASLLQGTVSIFDRGLRVRRVVRLAAATRDVAIAIP